MLFNYKATTSTGESQAGSIDAANRESAIASLQRRGLIILELTPKARQSFLARRFAFFDQVSLKDIVILSRQISTLFEASVSVLSSFKLLSSETTNPVLRAKLVDITDDIQAGTTISEALAKHPKIFSPFYVSMVKAGEESGKLPEALNYLADYLERSYELVQRARNALIYPVFVVVVFILVVILMMVLVIPRLSEVLVAAGEEIPFYTRLVVAVSNFFVAYGIYLLILAIIAAFFVWRWIRTEVGRLSFDRFRLAIPYLGGLYQKLYLSRISDNFDTMLSSGIPVLRVIEISAEVVGNEVYKNILLETATSVKGGATLSNSFSQYREIPGIMVQMIRIGEETGKTGFVLKTLARFYKREVDAAVDTIVNLIEPFLILILGLGVGIVMAAILIPIYNIASAI